MKRMILIILLVCLLSACGGSYDGVVQMKGILRYYETTLEGLESRASNIVIGRLGGDAKTAYATRNRETPSPRYTLVSLEITKVIEGELKAEETVNIIEPYYIEDRVLYTWDNYAPSKPGEKYIFFLGKQATETAPEGCAGAHFVIHLDRGRYLVPDAERLSAQDYSRKELSLGELATELYMRLYQEVINAYIK